MLWSIAVALLLYSAVAAAFAQRGPLRLGSQLAAFGRLPQPKTEKKREALSPVQADLNTTSPLSAVNIGAASLVGIFAILLVLSQTQQEQGKMLTEQGKTLTELGKTQQEQGKMLTEQGKMLAQLDSKFSQVQTDVSTFSSVVATVSTSLVATTYLTQTILGKRAADEGASDK